MNIKVQKHSYMNTNAFVKLCFNARSFTTIHGHCRSSYCKIAAPV